MAIGIRLGLTLGRKAGTAGPPPFSPLDLSPALWLKSDAGLFQERTGAAATTPAAADADPVGTWKDQSGNGRHFIAATDARRPTLKLAIQNGLPVVRADGVDDYLRATLTLAQPIHVFGIWRLRSWAGSKYLFDGHTNDVCGVLFYGPATRIDQFAPTDGIQKATDLNFHTWGHLFNDTNSKVRYDGAVGSTGSCGTNGYPSAMTLMARGDAAAFFGDFDLLEFLAFPAEITGTNLTNLETYLRARGATW